MNAPHVKSSPKPWVVDFTPSRTAQTKLLCLPFAGGGANAYRPWVAALPAWMGLAAAQLPGREARITETPLDNVNQIVKHLVEALLPTVQKAPFALFGHSMGAVLAWELARALWDRHAIAPSHLFLSAHRAPGYPRLSPAIHDLPDPAFRAALGRLGGTPPEVLAHDELMALMLPILRADFTLVERWLPTKAKMLECPITTFAGADDVEAPPSSMTGWSNATKGAVAHHTLAGDHFFINTNRARLLDHISAAMIL